MATRAPNVHVVDAVQSLFSDGEQTIIWYGSRREGRDIDLLAIDDSASGTTSMRLGRIDLAAMTRWQFERLSTVADPVVTEPVLTGVLLVGDTAVFDDARTRLIGAHPRAEAVEHALRRSHEDSASVPRFLTQYRELQDHRCLHWALHNLSFAIAYLSFARRYSAPHATVCTLRQLRDEGDVLLPEFWDWYDVAKHNSHISPAEAMMWVDRWNTACIG